MSFRDVETKLHDEVIYGMYEGMSDKFIEKLVEQKRKALIKPDFTFIIAHCIYNEEQFLQQTLEDDLNVDVDIIHILDGSWELFDGGHWCSTDKTIKIIKAFKKKAEKVGIKVIYEAHPKHEIWENQAIKRNYQTDQIHKLVKTPYYIMIKDGDEVFKFLSGRINVWLKKEMVQWIKKPANVGLMYTHALHSDKQGMGVRFIPSTRPLHWHTGKNMVLHDKDHNLIMNYNKGQMKSDKTKCFLWGSGILVNYWGERNADKMKKKVDYIINRRKLPKTEHCNY